MPAASPAVSPLSPTGGDGSPGSSRGSEGWRRHRGPEEPILQQPRHSGVRAPVGSSTHRARRRQSQGCWAPGTDWVRAGSRRAQSGASPPQPPRGHTRSSAGTEGAAPGTGKGHGGTCPAHSPHSSTPWAPAARTGCSRVLRGARSDSGGAQPLVAPPASRFPPASTCQAPHGLMECQPSVARSQNKQPWAGCVCRVFALTAGTAAPGARCVPALPAPPSHQRPARHGLWGAEGCNEPGCQAVGHPLWSAAAGGSLLEPGDPWQPGEISSTTRLVCGESRVRGPGQRSCSRSRCGAGAGDALGPGTACSDARGKGPGHSWARGSS